MAAVVERFLTAEAATERPGNAPAAAGPSASPGGWRKARA